jgi:hypothetical protein
MQLGLMMIILIIKDITGNITRMVEESDEQYEKRIQRAKISVAELKKRRYENYLKLKRI